jgi:hypothetical protein
LRSFKAIERLIQGAWEDLCVGDVGQKTVDP